MSSIAGPSRSILLLDDDADVGIAAQLLLQRRVAPVTCLRRPAELVAALDRLRPSLLLLDLNFGPGRTDGAQGMQLLDGIRTRILPPVVVVLTAYADIDLAVRALKRGAVRFYCEAVGQRASDFYVSGSATARAFGIERARGTFAGRH